MIFLKPLRPVHSVFLHCSASDRPEHDDVEVIRQWHIKERGWDDIGYHFFITKGGVVQPGRDLEKVPAAQQGHNVGTIAICCHGLEKRRFTDQQMAALYNLCVDINEVYDGKVTFHGHCEVAPKACPVFDYKTVLQLDSHGYMNLGRPPLIGMEVLGHLDGDLPVLGTGTKSLAVAAAQKLLGVPVDGVMGQDTLRATERFQEAQGLPKTGTIDRITWDRLVTQ